MFSKNDVQKLTQKCSKLTRASFDGTLIDDATHGRLSQNCPAELELLSIADCENVSEEVMEGFIKAADTKLKLLNISEI